MRKNKSSGSIQQYKVTCIILLNGKEILSCDYVNTKVVTATLNTATNSLIFGRFNYKLRKVERAPEPSDRAKMLVVGHHSLAHLHIGIVTDTPFSGRTGSHANRKSRLRRLSRKLVRKISAPSILH